MLVQLRPSTIHIKMVLPSLLVNSQGWRLCARCASTGDQQPPHPYLLRAHSGSTGPAWVAIHSLIV
jgi:hypothetical protein